MHAFITARFYGVGSSRTGFSSAIKIVCALLGASTLYACAVQGDRVRGYDTIYRPNGREPFPAVILLHGCGGPSELEAMWAERLRGWGFLAIRVDSFAPRGITRACGGRTGLPEERVNDVFDALVYLKTRPDVDQKRIAAIGWSQGGTTLLNALGDRPEDTSTGFRAVIAFYPRCRPAGGKTWRAKTPLLLLLGELDDWTGAKPCERMATQLSRAGFDVRYRTYPGAHHAFDFPGLQTRRVPDANGGRGATVGYNSAAAADSEVQVRKFLAEHFHTTQK